MLGWFRSLVPLYCVFGGLVVLVGGGMGRIGYRLGQIRMGRSSHIGELAFGGLYQGEEA